MLDRVPSDGADGSPAPLHVVSILTTHAAGGAEFAAVDMLDVLRRRGARVRLLTNHVELAAGTAVDAEPLDLGPKLRRKTLAGTTARAPMTLADMRAALYWEARAIPIDVLLVHFKKEQLLASLLPRSLVRAVVWVEWGPLPEPLRIGLPRLAYAAAARRAAAVIAESAATERSLTGAGVPSRSIEVIPNVLDAGRLAFDPAARSQYRRRWDLPDDAFVLGCISRLDAAKRIDVAIDALEHLDPRVTLVIAGEGEDEAALRRRAARFGARVRFVGGARGRVAQILSACDAQVYAPGPSEGAARAITFGQLAGRPVIATAPEGARELVVAGTGTIVSPPNDARALASCIEDYRADPERVAREGDAGRRHAVTRIERADAGNRLERTLRAAASRRDSRDQPRDLPSLHGRVRRRAHTSPPTMRAFSPASEAWTQNGAAPVAVAGDGSDDLRTLRGEEIVCVGFAEWNTELLTNQHHLMSRLTQTNRVLFIESLGLRRPQFTARDLRRLARRLRDGLRGFRREGDVHVVSPIALPAHGYPALRMVNRYLLRKQVAHAVACLGFDRPVLWAYAPHAEALIDTLDPSLVIYHCVDDLAAQPGVHAASFRAAERRYVARADLVLASAPSLAARLREVSDRVLDAPNVADVAYFATALEEGPVDDALARLPPPRIVFTGAIVATKVDMHWLADLARLCPRWSFALVGPVGAGDPRTDVSELRAVPNIHFLGSRPYQRLPEVLRGADAGLIPYALNPLTASVFPMKVYEYLSAGLPVVATPLPALEGVAEVTRAEDVRSAAEHLARLIAENSPQRRRERSLSAVGHSWADRLAEIASAAQRARARTGTEPRWSTEDLVVDVENP